MELALLLGGGYLAYRAYQSRNDAKGRAAETFMPQIEKKKLTRVEPTQEKNSVPVSRALIAATLNTYQGGYLPTNDVPPDQAEEAMKSLNIANKFTYV